MGVVSAAEDMRSEWLREDVARRDVEIARLRERLRMANEQIGALRAELEIQRRSGR